ncbi:MAG: UbiA prenyltransferase family protein [Chloroflexi bacterium]|nr:UbiA prenyltransferase family protein [Chloroflexota bacterium]
MLPHSPIFVDNAVTLARRLKLFLALSRTLQATLSIAQPGLGAVLAVGAIPPADKTVVGVIAAWAGLHAVFAMNDLLDVEFDRRRFQRVRTYQGFDIDAAIVRHPLALGYISPTSAVLWIAFLTTIALVAAFWLSPISAALFVSSVILEWGYCKLAKVSPWKFLPTGLMIGFGSLAGWFAVSNEVNLTLVVFFLWMAAWEIGGRNIVNDWSDIEEDIYLGIKTVPATFGVGSAGKLAFVGIVLTFLLSLALAFTANLSWLYLVGAMVAGVYMLLVPGLRLLREPDRIELAPILFNRASLYPAAMLAIVVVSIYVPHVVDWVTSWVYVPVR